jgi:NADH:ubiquinone oxidoreductase subunit 4 (subunit M)
MELLPHVHSIFAPWLVVIGAIQIVIATFTSFNQHSLKRRIVYSSISHMGFVLIRIGSIIYMFHQTFYGYKLFEFVTSSKNDARPQEMFIPSHLRY